MNKGKIKIGIYAVALLLMGAISVSSSLSVIAARFPDQSQTMIQNLISIPCLIVIVTTLITGKVLTKISPKTMAIVASMFFLVGGLAPIVLHTSFAVILVFRGIYGLGIGIGQVVCSALIAEHFEGAERNKVQGTMTAMQMAGCCVMVFASGWLGNLAWDKAFYVHLIGVVALLGALLFLPGGKATAPTQETAEADAAAPRAKLTKSAWCWAITMFLTFIFGQIYSVYLSFIVAEKGIGTAADSGNSLAFFCIGGIILGFLYGKMVGRTKTFTMAVAFFGAAVAYLLIALAGNMALIHLGSFLFGVAISTHMSCIMIGTGSSVSPLAASLAIAITMCAQNVGQFLSPYLMNIISGAVATAAPVQFTYLLGVAGEILCAVYAVFWGIRTAKKASV